jgi:transcriptional regulator with GAF, ATPase, and Fis domain
VHPENSKGRPPRICLRSCIARSDDPAALIVETLTRTGGVVYHAAHELGVTREALRQWIVKLGLYPTVKRIRAEAKAARWKHPPVAFS